MVERQQSIKRKLLSKPHPENLILTVMRGTIDSIEITPDILAGVEYTLSTLTAVEQEVLKLRFQERMTYAEIGKARGHTGHGACGTEDNAMRKLRQNSRLGFLLYGKDGFDAMERVFRRPGETPSPAKPEQDPKVLLIPFEELDLTVRSFNSLRRAGYEFVGDIVNLTYEQILKIKSLPRKNCIEVALKLRQLGLRDTSWKDFI